MKKNLKLNSSEIDNNTEKRYIINISLKTRALLIGAFILIAYGSAISLAVESLVIALIIESISGLTVVAAAILYLPILKPHNKIITYGYTFIKCIEGMLIIIGAFFFLPLIMNGTTSEIWVNDSRDLVYLIIEYLFGFRFLLLAILFYQSKLIPRFISIWGLIGSVSLIISALINLIVGNTFVPFYISHLPVITNEIFLAIWLMIKGFDKEHILT